VEERKQQILTAFISLLKLMESYRLGDLTLTLSGLIAGSVRVVPQRDEKDSDGPEERASPELVQETEQKKKKPTTPKG